MELFNVVIILANFVNVFGDDPPVKFLLVNPWDSKDRTELVDDFSRMDSNIETIFIIHGWLETKTISYYNAIAQEYHTKGTYNVILVDWDQISSQFYFIRAAPQTKIVGPFLGEFLLKLNSQIGLDFEKMHLIGHSLGAHIAGFAGRRVLQEGHKIGRITALDAANPSFSTYTMHNADHRLTSNDATSVVVLHTDTGGFGIRAPIGTVDFYANGGVAPQPACYHVKSFWELINPTSYFCSHQMSWSYFIESINSKTGFIGKNCTSISIFGKCDESQRAVFGPDTPAGTRGIFYFKTNVEPFYAKGMDGL